MAEPHLTSERLRELLHYDPETGIFTWRVRASSSAQIGAVAGSPEKDGRVRITVDGKHYLAYRLAWLWVLGGWPEHQIDHEDGDPSNNRWANLREATHAQNQQNIRRAKKNSTHGFLGVTKSRDKWRCGIRLNGKYHGRCGFPTPEAAHAAYLELKRELHEFCTI